VQVRKRLLEVFLQKVVSVPFLYGGEEFQLFIRSATDFKALIEKKKTASIRTIATTYITTFPEYDVREVQPRVETNLCTSRTAIAAIATTMTNVSEAIRRTCLSAVMFQQMQVRMGECWEGFQHTYCKEVEEKRGNRTFKMWKDKGEVEGLQKLSDWAQVEVMDLRALLEAFQSLEAIKTQRNKRSASLLKAKGKLEVLNADKHPKKFQELSQKISTLEQDIESFSRTVAIASIRLHDFELPHFKAAKILGYYSILRRYTVANAAEAQSALEVLTALL